LSNVDQHLTISQVAQSRLKQLQRLICKLLKLKSSEVMVHKQHWIRLLRRMLEQLALSMATIDATMSWLELDTTISEKVWNSRKQRPQHLNLLVLSILSTELQLNSKDRWILQPSQALNQLQ
jgi:hypothetical protein